MTDGEIIALFLARSEGAIEETAKKYGAACMKLARNILNDQQDAEECVNDAYLALWDAIPPQTPDPLSAYLCRIVRNLSIKKYRANAALKRNSAYDAALDELADCIPARQGVEDEVTARELPALLDRFLETLGKEERVLFLRRYWYADTVAELGERFGMDRHLVSVRLSRTRGKLKRFLRKEGYSI